MRWLRYFRIPNQKIAIFPNQENFRPEQGSADQKFGCLNRHHFLVGLTKKNRYLNGPTPTKD